MAKKWKGNESKDPSLIFFHLRTSSFSFHFHSFSSMQIQQSWNFHFHLIYFLIQYTDFLTIPPFYSFRIPRISTIKSIFLFWASLSLHVSSRKRALGEPVIQHDKGTPFEWTSLLYSWMNWSSKTLLTMHFFCTSYSSQYIASWPSIPLSNTTNEGTLLKPTAWCNFSQWSCTCI